MATRRTTIGFVGLGHMGGNMAARFLAAGYPVYGEARSREHAQQLIDEGLQWRDTPREIAEAADVVFTSVPDDGVLEDVASGPDGILAGLGAGKIWVDVSTVSPQVSRELARECTSAGRAMLDAPVSGSVPQVQSGTLTIMVGGDEDAYARSSRSCASSARRRTSATTARGSRSSSRSTSASPCRCSPSPRACCSPSASGVDRQRALEVMEASPIGSPMLKARAVDHSRPARRGVVRRRASCTRTSSSRSTRRGGFEIPLPTAERADEVLDAANELGYERRDLAALFQVLEQIANGDRGRR